VDDFIYISAGSALYALSVSGASPLTAPSDLDAQVAIGRALWMKGDLQNAKATLKAVVEAKPNVTVAWALLAEIFEGLEENTDAIQSWLRVNEYALPVDEDYQKSLRHLEKLVGLRWRFKPYPAYSSNAKQVTATKGKVYVQGWNFLYILERETGKLVEKHEDGKVFPYLVEGIVYVHYDGKLYAVEAQTDQLLWTYDIRSLLEAFLK
jgi:outer membrane protein assembly factor BamB